MTSMIGDDDAQAQPQTRLFAPLKLRSVTLPNRVMISPMCMYAAKDGVVNDFHLVQLGRYALGGAGLVFAEASAVMPRGRNSHGDAGLWSDRHVEPWRRVTDFMRAHGAVPGIQLAHAGRKASTDFPWNGGASLTGLDAVRGHPAWQTVGPSAERAGPEWAPPAALTVGDIGELVAAWRDAAARALHAGFDVIEVHGAHGYLIHSFLSPISNTREDEYGGDLARRMRLALEIACAIREVWPSNLPLFWRVSALDGIDGGWTIEDTIVLSRALADCGVDVIDTSSGGIVMDPSVYRRIRRGYAFHTPYAARIRRETGMCVATVGLIVDGIQAEGILARGEADIIAVGREALVNPNWALAARSLLQDGGFEGWPQESGYWLGAREPAMRRLREAGEDPRVPRHETPAA